MSRAGAFDPVKLNISSPGVLHQPWENNKTPKKVKCDTAITIPIRSQMRLNHTDLGGSECGSKQTYADIVKASVYRQTISKVKTNSKQIESTNSG